MCHPFSTNRQQRGLSGFAVAVAFVMHWSAIVPLRAAILGFQPEIDGRVYAVAAQPDGRVVIGGAFQRISGLPRQNLARLLPDGRVDPDFRFDANSTVLALLALPDGTVLVGGFFTTINKEQRPGLIRIRRDGTLDRSFAVATDGVRAITVDAQGRVLFGGNGAAVNGFKRWGIARVHASGLLDMEFAPQVSGTVYSLLPLPNGGCLVGGGHFLKAFDATGNLLPGWILPIAGGNGVFGLHAGSAGAVIVSGEFVVRDSPHRNLTRFNADGVLDAGYPAQPIEEGLLAAVQGPDARLYIVRGRGAIVGPQSDEISCLEADGSQVPGWGGRLAGQPFAMTLQADGAVVVAGNDLSARIPGLSSYQSGYTGGVARFLPVAGAFDYSPYTFWSIRRFGGEQAWDEAISGPLAIPYPGLLPNVIDYALARWGKPDAGVTPVVPLDGGGHRVSFHYSRTAFDSEVTLQMACVPGDPKWRDVARATRGGPLALLGTGGSIIQAEGEGHVSYDQPAPDFGSAPGSTLYRVSVQRLPLP